MTTSNFSKKNTLFYLVYLLSFIPYLYLAYLSIFGIDIGFFGQSTRVYGFQALFLPLYYLSIIIPLYPILLIFQAIYTIKKYQSFSDTQKCQTKILISTLLALIIIPALIHSVMHN